MNIYVGNLARDVTEDDLREAFEGFGQVASASVIKDKFTHESRGFGFVEMPSQSEAKAAITGLNGTELKGRALNVNEARPELTRRVVEGAAGVAVVAANIAEVGAAAGTPGNHGRIAVGAPKMLKARGWPVVSVSCFARDCPFAMCRVSAAHAPH